LANRHSSCLSEALHPDAIFLLQTEFAEESSSHRFVATHDVKPKEAASLEELAQIGLVAARWMLRALTIVATIDPGCVPKGDVFELSSMIRPPGVRCVVETQIKDMIQWLLTGLLWPSYRLAAMPDAQSNGPLWGQPG
jgi:hypothetical protein